MYNVYTQVSTLGPIINSILIHTNVVFASSALNHKVGKLSLTPAHLQLINMHLSFSPFVVFPIFIPVQAVATSFTTCPLVSPRGVTQCSEKTPQVHCTCMAMLCTVQSSKYKVQ